MHYVKQFNINGVDTTQVSCIELRGKPNAATEGMVGLLGIDVISPLHEVYKCVAVNGSIYTWELLSSGLSTITSTISGEGEETIQFPYTTLKTPPGYLLKKGDLIIDSKGYLYQVDAIDIASCGASYTGTAFTKGDEGAPGVSPHIGANGNWWIGDEDTGVSASMQSATGTFYVITESTSETETHTEFAIALDFEPKLIVGIFVDRYGMFIWARDKFQFRFDNTGYGGNAPYLNGKIYADWWNRITTGECRFVALA